MYLSTSAYVCQVDVQQQFELLLVPVMHQLLDATSEQIGVLNL